MSQTQAPDDRNGTERRPSAVGTSAAHETGNDQNNKHIIEKDPLRSSHASPP